MDERRVAIVTGGTRGIGVGISVALAKSGHKVFAVYRSNEQSATDTLAELNAISEGHEAIKGDVSNSADVARIVNYVGEKCGRIDVLVNNAGIFDFSFIEDMTEEFLDNIYKVNFKSDFLMMKACIPYMKKNRFGRIINASSISSSFADVGLVGYGMSKAGVDMLTKIGASELGPYQITVNAFAPGITHTDMTDEMIRTRGDKQVKQIALGRFGDVADAGALVNFLASDAAGYITGEIIGVDGGMLKVQNPHRAHEYAAGETSK